VHALACLAVASWCQLTTKESRLPLHSVIAQRLFLIWDTHSSRKQAITSRSGRDMQHPSASTCTRVRHHLTSGGRLASNRQSGIADQGRITGPALVLGWSAVALVSPHTPGLFQHLIVAQVVSLTDTLWDLSHEAPRPCRSS
jgi:hypothetical protein